MRVVIVIVLMLWCGTALAETNPCNSWNDGYFGNQPCYDLWRIANAQERTANALEKIATALNKRGGEDMGGKG